VVERRKCVTLPVRGEARRRMSCDRTAQGCQRLPAEHRTRREIIVWLKKLSYPPDRVCNNFCLSKRITHDGNCSLVMYLIE
jgi:hypothetical protein